jgi:hypothetical protein
MSDIFNTLFEVSLRVLLVLETAGKRKISTDMIAAADFITVYGKDFDISDENLHGDNNFKFSEFAVRRGNVSKAVKQLVLDGLVTVVIRQSGFAYSITKAGSDYCAKFENEYAAIYRALAQRTWELISQKPERAVIELINRHSVSSVKRGEMNG